MNPFDDPELRGALLACGSAADLAALLTSHGVPVLADDPIVDVLWEQVLDLRSGGEISRAERRYARGYLRCKRASNLRERADKLEQRLPVTENTGALPLTPASLPHLKVRSWRAQADLLEVQGRADMESAEDVFDKHDESEVLPLYQHLLWQFDEPHRLAEMLDEDPTLPEFLDAAMGLGDPQKLEAVWVRRQAYLQKQRNHIEHLERASKRHSDAIVRLERDVAQSRRHLSRLRVEGRSDLEVERARVKVKRAQISLHREELRLCAERMENLRDLTDGPGDVPL